MVSAGASCGEGLTRRKAIRTPVASSEGGGRARPDTETCCGVKAQVILAEDAWTFC